MKRSFAIYDWAGNRLSRWGTFPTFQDAWDFILGEMAEALSLSEEDFQEYEVRTV